MGKLVVTQTTINYILKSYPDKIKDIEVLGIPELKVKENKEHNYFIFKDE